MEKITSSSLKISWILLVMLSLISFASASIDYIEENETYIIDSFLPTWLFGDGESTVTLIENTDHCLINCEATLKFTNEEPLILTEEINFIDRQGRNVIDNIRDLEFLLGKYKDVEKRKPIYSEVCEEILSNSTNQIENICHEEQTGEETYLVNELVWGKYLGTEEIGESYLKIKGKKTPLKDIDWIITFRGKDLDSWAWWNSNWLYKREISNLTGNISALFSINYSSNMKSNFSDLRFLDNATESIELNYTIEKYIDSTSAVIRVNNLGANSIKMYYGNSIATTTENASNVYFNPFNLYYFDDNTKDFITGNSATNNGASLMDGYINRSYYFDGVTDYISNVGVPPTSYISVNTWVSFNASHTENYAGLYDGFRGGDIKYTIRRSVATSNIQFLLRDTSDAYTTLTSTSLPLDNTFHMITSTINGTHANLYIDGVLEDSDAFTQTMQLDTVQIGQDSTSLNSWKGYIDEVYVYDYSLTQEQIIQIYTQTESDFIEGAEEALEGVDTILIQPETGSNFTDTYINFTFSSIPNSVNLTNATSYLWNETDGSLILTNFTTLTGNQTINTSFQNNLSQGNYEWNALTCAENVNCFFATSNNSFVVHTGIPEILIPRPVGIIDYFLLGDNQTLNYSITEDGANDSSHFTNCYYEYNNITNSLNCTGTSTSFTYVLGKNNLTVIAIDEFGLVSTNSTSWEYEILEINQTFNNISVEGNTQDISALIKLGSGLTISAAILDYNGTLSSGTSTINGENINILRSNLITNSVVQDENITFHWIIVLSGGQTINLTENNQTILNIGIDNCSSFTTEILNITIVDEEMQTIISSGTTLEIALSILSEDRSIIVTNFSQQFDETNPIGICINRVITTDTEYSLDSIIKYSATGYANEYYNIVDTQLDNDTGTIELILYDLNETDSTEFQLTFKGTDFLPAENVLVFVDRQYISEDTFKTVELPKTDSNGQTVLHLVRNSVIYNMVFIKDDVVLRSFNNIVAFCQDFTIGSCTLKLNAVDNESGLFNYDNEVGIIYSSKPDYNETSKTVSFQFISSDGSTKVLFMEVERRDVFGNRSICNNTVVSSSGTLSCTISEDIDDTSLITIISVDGEEWLTFSTIIDDTGYGSMGYAIWFIMTLALILIFGESKNGVMISILISYIGAVGLGIGIGGVIGIGSAGIWVLVITLVGIYKINKNRKR